LLEKKTFFVIHEFQHGFQTQEEKEEAQDRLSRKRGTGTKYLVCQMLGHHQMKPRSLRVARSAFIAIFTIFSRLYSQMHRAIGLRINPTHSQPKYGNILVVLTASYTRET
jgi:hypothetical protein